MILKFFTLACVWFAFGPLQELEKEKPTLNQDLEWETILAHSGFKEELEIDEKQKRSFRSSSFGFTKSMRLDLQDLLKTYEGNPVDVANSKVYDEIRNDHRFELGKSLSRVIGPEKMTRLNQLGFWVTINRKGMVKEISEGVLSKTCEISKETKEILLDKSAELQAEFESKVADLRQKYRKRLIEELDADQRGRFEELLGRQSNIGGHRVKF